MGVWTQGEATGCGAGLVGGEEAGDLWAAVISQTFRDGWSQARCEAAGQRGQARAESAGCTFY